MKYYFHKICFDKNIMVIHEGKFLCWFIDRNSPYAPLWKGGIFYPIGGGPENVKSLMSIWKWSCDIFKELKSKEEILAYVLAYDLVPTTEEFQFQEPTKDE